jgi:hypothetical protein
MEFTMDKGFFLFVLFGMGFLYFVTNFIGDIQEDDEVYQNNEYKQEHKYDQYQHIDSIGQEILNLTGVDTQTQIAAWNASGLKQELLELFPDFGDMKRFVKERVEGDPIQTKLIEHIDRIEGQFFSGKINAEKAKQVLGILK